MSIRSSSTENRVIYLIAEHVVAAYFVTKVKKRAAMPAPVIVQELCESRGGRPGLSVLTSLLVSVDVKNY